VVPDEVTLRCDAANDGRGARDTLTDEEEGCSDAECGEQIENSGRPLQVWTVIERQVNRAGKAPNSARD
jgi:hypothetical protein